MPSQFVEKCCKHKTFNLFSAATCAWSKTPLSLQTCEPPAFGGRGVRCSGLQVHRECGFVPGGRLSKTCFSTASEGILRNASSAICPLFISGSITPPGAIHEARPLPGYSTDSRAAALPGPEHGAAFWWSTACLPPRRRGRCAWRKQGSS